MISKLTCLEIQMESNPLIDIPHDDELLDGDFKLQAMVEKLKDDYLCVRRLKEKLKAKRKLEQ